MSSFFIKVEDGAPVGFPMSLSSARSLGYHEHGYRNGEIPEDLEKFVPKDEPSINWNEVVETDGEYHKVDGAWQREFFVRPKTAEELEAYKAEVEAAWNAGLAYASWTYNDKSGQMSPPVLPSPDLKNVQWDEESGSWTGEPLGPEDAKII